MYGAYKSIKIYSAIINKDIRVLDKFHDFLKIFKDNRTNPLVFEASSVM